MDARITREFATALHAEGVGRREWMLLNTIATTGDLPSSGPWSVRREGRPSRPLRSLAERGWAAQGADGTWSLTTAGAAARERLAGTVDGIREQVAAAVTPEAYATTMASLEAIARALGRDETGDGDVAESAHGPDGRCGRGRGRGRRHGHDRGHGRGRGRGHHHGHSRGEAREWGRGRGNGRGRFHAHHHAHRHAQRAFERAFERGFERGHDAGFARGRRAGDA